MATFSYIARTAAGERIDGTLAGSSEQAVVAELHARDLAPVEVREVRDKTAGGGRIPIRTLANAYRQMADLLRAGVPLLRSLRILGRSKANPRLAAVMAKVADRVAEGERLGDAMGEHPRVFPQIQLAMVRAGERGGFLEPVLARLAAFLEHQADLRARVVGALIYPVVLLAVSTLVVVGALVFFVPKFEKFYAKTSIPLPTQIVLTTSDILTNHGYVIIIVAVAAFFGWRHVRSKPGVQRFIATQQLRIPKLGPLIRSLAVARFARVLGTLLENGIPMLAAMQISRDAAGHLLLAEAIDEATEAVRRGEPLAQPLAASGLLSEDVVEMISVGESANNLPDVLGTIADTIEGRVDRLLNVLVRLLEPLLLLTLGGVILFIFLALVVPMIQMSAGLAS